MDKNISDDMTVVTSTYVIEDKMPVLEVSCEDDEEDGVLLQFHCGNGDYDRSKILLVRLSTVLALDSSLKEIVNLTVGKTIVRSSTNSPWENL